MSLCEFLGRNLGVNYVGKVYGRDRCVFVFKGGVPSIIDLTESGGGVNVSVRFRYEVLKLSEPVVVVSSERAGRSVASVTTFRDGAMVSREVSIVPEVLVVTRDKKSGRLVMYVDAR